MAKPFVIHTPEEIVAIKRAAAMTADAREQIAESVRAGMTTAELDLIAYEIIKGMGGECAFYNYNGYPAHICISVNDEVVHGIASRTKIIENGDIVSVDVGVAFGGGIGDSAKSVYVGGEPPAAERNLLEATEEALEAGIKAAVCGNCINHISAAVQAVAKRRGVAIVREYIGHGCGTRLHEPPEVPNYVTLRKGPTLQPGMVLCIEPMFNMGTYRVYVKPDQWTVCTADGKPSAHFEHMVLITNDKPEVLTRA